MVSLESVVSLGLKVEGPARRMVTLNRMGTNGGDVGLCGFWSVHWELMGAWGG